VLYDDRPKVSPGVKFKDAELLGMPTIVVVGKGLAAGTVEVRDRRSGDARRSVSARSASWPRSCLTGTRGRARNRRSCARQRQVRGVRGHGGRGGDLRLGSTPTPGISRPGRAVAIYALHYAADR
jgi:hypothetical protein